MVVPCWLFLLADCFCFRNGAESFPLWSLDACNYLAFSLTHIKKLDYDYSKLVNIAFVHAYIKAWFGFVALSTGFFNDEPSSCFCSSLHFLPVFSKQPVCAHSSRCTLHVCTGSTTSAAVSAPRLTAWCQRQSASVQVQRCPWTQRWLGDRCVCCGDRHALQ